MNEVKKKKWWQVVGTFAIETVVGMSVFTIIALAAVALEKLIVVLHHSWALSAFATSILEFVAHGMLMVDAVLLLTFVTITAWKAIKEM